MKKHYDFSKAKHEPKFYRPIEKLIAPPYAENKIIEREQKTAERGAKIDRKVEKVKIKSLTRPFHELVQERASRDPKFRKGLITGALSALQDGEPKVAKKLLDHAKAAFSPKRKYKSRIDQAIHETAEGMFKIGAIDKKTMRDFDKSCLIDADKESERPMAKVRKKR